MDKKRLLCFAMAAMLACGGFFGMPAFAGEMQVTEIEDEEVSEDGNYHYRELEDGTLKITGCAIWEGKIVVPSEIGGKQVTVIGDRAFANCMQVTELVLPAGIREIGDSAFYFCNSLKRIELPEGLKAIGADAFNGCYSLTEIHFPAELEMIGRAAFYYTGSLTDITVAPGNTAYESENGVLYNKGKTKLICCPAAKKGSFKVAETVTAIEDRAITYSASLTEIELPDGLETIGEEAFFACYDLTILNLPAGVREIGKSAFEGCNLTGLNIPAGFREIGEAAFAGCSWKEISIPAGVTEIKKEAFRGCDMQRVQFPDGLEIIGDGAFCECGSLTEVSLPAGVREIGQYAFDDCDNLTGMSIPASVEKIGEYAFPYDLKDIFYAGSEADWAKIDNGSYVDPAILHFNAQKPVGGEGNHQKPGGEQGSNPKPGGNSVTPSAVKKDQSVTANNVTKTYGEKPFSLGASALGNVALSYVSSDNSVASVDKSGGKVTITGCGVTKITVTAAETKDYKSASKTVLLTVKPKRASLVSVKSKKKKTALVKWKKDAKAAGYLIWLSTDKKFKKNVKKVTVSKAKTTSQTVKKLSGGKKYYVRICAYAKDGKNKVQGAWSASKTVKVKK